MTLRKLISIGIGAACALAGSPAASEMLPSGPAEIAAAGLDCWSAVSNAPVNEAVLNSRGWSKAKVTTAAGQPIKSALNMYGKKGTGALIMLSPTVDPRGCMIVSSARTAADISASIPILLQGLKAIDPKIEVKKIAAGEVAFFALPKAAILKLTGNPAKPGVMIQVSYTAQEKK